MGKLRSINSEIKVKTGGAVQEKLYTMAGAKILFIHLALTFTFFILVQSAENVVTHVSMQILNVKVILL